MRDHRPTLIRGVSVTIRDVIHRGTYFVQGSMVHVQSSFGAKAIPVGDSSPRDDREDAAVGISASQREHRLTPDRLIRPDPTACSTQGHSFSRRTTKICLTQLIPEMPSASAINTQRPRIS